MPNMRPIPTRVPAVAAFADNLPGNLYRRVRRPDGSYYFAYLSSGLFRQFGVDPRRLMAETAIRFDWVHPEDRDRFVTDLEMSAATLGLLDHRVRVVGQDGRVHWARGIARPSRKPDGTVVWDGLVIDVTREVEAEAALRIAKAEADRAHHDVGQTVATTLDRLARPVDELEGVVRALAEGGDRAAGVERLRAIVGRLRAALAAPRPTAQVAPPRALTPRQIDVMALMQAGKSNKAIALALDITPGTAKLHVAAVLRATGARSRRDLGPRATVNAAARVRSARTNSGSGSRSPS
jgi:DNA-binding NarL/FixJ family response regulator